MPFKFNPFSGNFDQTGSGGGGGGACYIDGEVQNFSALPQTIGSPAVDSAYLVRQAEGAWLLNRKPAGIYIRTANTGVRASDWTHASAFPDVFNDANLVVYANSDSSKNVKFDVSAIATGTTRTITVPDNDVTLPDQGTSTGDTVQFAGIAIDEAAPSRTYHQSGSKFLVHSNNSSYGQMQLANPLDGECTFVLASQANPNSNGESFVNSTNPSDDYASSAHVWAFGIGPYGLGSQNFVINNNSLGAGSPAAIIKNDGKVGLGVASPATQLDVKGKIRLADTSDATKQVELSAASVGAGQVRVVTFPNKNITLDDAGDARTPTSHTHGNLTNDGKVGSDSGRVLVTTTAGAVTTLALGTANQVLRTKSDLSGVEFADPSGGGVTGAAASASDVLGVSGANITGVDANADRIVFWDDSASALKYLEVSTGLSLSGTTLTATATGGGTKTYSVFTALDNNPPATAFATIDQRNSTAVLDFDAATDENAVFVGIMPEAASLGSGLIVRLHWMATTATSGNVRWGVQFERSNTDLDSDSFDTAVEATAAANGTSGILTTTAITVTTIDGITAGDVFRLKVFRNADDATNDTMTGDAELVAVEVRSAA